MKKDLIRKLLFVFLGVVLIVIVSIGLIWWNKPKNKVLRAVGKTVSDWEHTGYQTENGTMWLELVSNMAMKNASGSYSINLSNIPDLDWTIGLDGTYIRNMDDKLLKADLNVSVANYIVAKSNLYADESKTYLSIPDLIDETLTIDNTTLGKDWNQSSWCDLVGGKLPEDFSLNWFAGSGFVQKDMQMTSMKEDFLTSMNESNVGTPDGEKQFEDAEGNKLDTKRYPVDFEWKEHSYQVYVYLDKKGNLISIETAEVRVCFLGTEKRIDSTKLETSIIDEQGTECSLEFQLNAATWTNGFGELKPEFQITGTLETRNSNEQSAIAETNDCSDYQMNWDMTIKNRKEQENTLKSNHMQDFSGIEVALDNLTLKENNEIITKITGDINISEEVNQENLEMNIREEDCKSLFQLTLWDILKNEKLFQLLGM